jgi:glucose-fructose oxidoreductase
MGVYAINGIRYAAGEEPIAVRNAKQFTKRPNLFLEVDETTEFELVFKNGLIGYGKTSVGDNGNQLKVTCQKGWYQLSPMQAYNGVKGNTSDGKMLNAFIQNQQAQQMDNDALAILNKTNVIAPGEEGQRDIRIVEAIIAAAQSGNEVTL